MREPEVSMTTSVRLWLGVSGLAAMAAVSVMVLAPVSPVLSSPPDARPTTAAPLGEIALVVEDRWQRLGLGTLLLDEILAEAAAHGIRELRADVLSHNRPMLHLLAQRTEIIRRTTDNGITEIHLRRRAG